MIKIRNTKPGDFREIMHVLEATKLVDGWLVENLFKKMLKQDRQLCFVATDHEKIVGTAFATSNGAWLGYLYKLAVLPDYQRQGIASRLIRARMDALKKMGITWVFSHVLKNNRASLGALRRRGLTPKKTHYLVDTRQA